MINTINQRKYAILCLRILLGKLGVIRMGQSFNDWDGYVRSVRRLKV